LTPMEDWRKRRSHADGFVAGALGFSDAAYGLLRDLIAQRTGSYYDDDRQDLLLERVAGLMAGRGISSLLDYYYLLKYDPSAAEAWAELQDRLAVPETYFWRQAEQFEALVGHVAPHFAKCRNSLQIWSAACCTGEEPLSMAMALDEAGWFQRLPIRIVATDASRGVVEKAREGLFPERSLRNLPTSWRERYFVADGNRWRIDPAIHARVSWGTANLVDEREVAPIATSSDVVFCRNVLIYFSDEGIRLVAQNPANHLPDDAYLFLGASESLMRIRTAFAMEEVGPAFVYRKAAQLERNRP
jgi:chemotaxis protein methyltransferase CheR